MPKKYKITQNVKKEFNHRINDEILNHHQVRIIGDNIESKVIDSRPSDSGASIRRRRECVSCGRKFTTYERVEDISLMVIKKE